MAADWPERRVGDLVRQGVLVISDGYRVRNEELGPQGIPFVRGGDIGDGWINTTTRDHIRPELAERVAAKIARPADVAFITKGNVGRAGRLRRGQPPVVFAPQVAYWRVTDTDVLDSGFVFYLIRSREFQAALNGVKTHGAMVADYVSISQQHDFRFRIPDIDSQRALSRILGALDDKIELNRRIWNTRLQLALALYGHLKDRRTGIVALGDLYEVGLSGVWGTDEPITAEAVPVHVARGRDLEALVDGVIPDVPVRFITRRQAAKRMPAVGEIWTAGSGSLGPTLLVTDRLLSMFDNTLTYSNFVKRLVPKSIGSGAFVAWLALVQAWRNGSFLEYSTGTAIPNLDAKALLTLEVPIIDRESADRLAQLVSFALDPGLLSESRTLAALRDALLPKLISGELRVKERARRHGGGIP